MWGLVNIINSPTTEVNFSLRPYSFIQRRNRKENTVCEETATIFECTSVQRLRLSLSTFFLPLSRITTSDTSLLRDTGTSRLWAFIVF